MKNFIYATLAFLLISCSITKPETKQSKKTLKGTWEVVNIRFVSDKGMNKASLFDLVDVNCFKGSEWVFIPENGRGKFTILNSGQCENSINRIHWSLHEPGDGTFQFQFKYVDTKNNPINNENRGYRSKIEQFDTNSMIMRIATTFEGNSFEIAMTFNKTSEEINL